MRHLAGPPAPELVAFWKRFSPCRVVLQKVTITYQPHGIKLPVAEETIEAFPLSLGGRTLLEVVQELA